VEHLNVATDERPGGGLDHQQLGIGRSVRPGTAMPLKRALAAAFTCLELPGAGDDEGDAS